MSAYNAFDHLPAGAAATYGDLLATLLAEGPRPPHGSFVSKVVRGRRYWYLQLTAAGRRRQVYLGPDGEVFDELRARAERDWEAAAVDKAGRARLVAVLASFGAPAPDGPSARVLDALADQGVFRAGGVLVGSHAFAAYGTLLGVRWSDHWQTADIDLAAPRRLQVAVDDRANLRAALESTGLQFDAVPMLEARQPSTAFRVRGTALFVELLTPLVGPNVDGPVMIPGLGSAAHPLRFLDYLIEQTSPCAIAARSGILVNVPAPARYALHKLLVAPRRGAHEAAKKRKDLAQADALLELLLEERPGDVLEAWDGLAGARTPWRERILEACASLRSAEGLASLVV